MGKYVLITNIDYVVIGDVRTSTHALLLEEWLGSLDGKSLRRRVRGFGTVPEWPVFDMEIPSIKHRLTDAKGMDIFSWGAGKPRPLVTRAILHIDGGPRLELWVHDQEKLIDETTFSPGTNIEEIWKVLPHKVASYWWPPYTNMPLLTWVPSRVVACMKVGR